MSTRITAKQVATIVKFVVDKNVAMTLAETEGKLLHIEASGYSLDISMADLPCRIISCVTPAGSGWSRSVDGGEPSEFLLGWQWRDFVSMAKAVEASALSAKEADAPIVIESEIIIDEAKPVKAAPKPRARAVKPVPAGTASPPCPLCAKVYQEDGKTGTPPTVAECEKLGNQEVRHLPLPKRLEPEPEAPRRVFVETWYKVVISVPGDDSRGAGVGPMFNHGATKGGKKFPEALTLSPSPYFTNLDEAEAAAAKYREYRAAEEADAAEKKNPAIKLKSTTKKNK